MKTAEYLVEYAKAQLGKPYWYATFGNTATEELYKYKVKQYPKFYASWNDFPKQYGQRVHDCVGLIKGALWSDTPTSAPKYTAAQDVSANGMLAKCAENGVIGTIPDIPGVLVFMDGHVGVYIGGGNVIEARGHEYGVVKTRLASRPWKWWGKCPWIDYGQSAKPAESGASGKTVKIKAGTTYNVRKLPDTKSDVIAVVKGGQEYKTLDGWTYLPELGGFVSNKAIE